MKYLSFFFLLILLACQPQSPEEQTATDEFTPTLEAITLLQDSLYSSVPESGAALDNYHASLSSYQQQADNPDSLIWHGRRTAYLGHFQKAIEIYTEGIKKHPQDARMYRHRGHRYISTRQYDKAIADFEKAAELISGQEDQVEPDGLPNDRNLPLSTLHGNIWYHLGLAYYLQNDMPNALGTFSNRTVTNRYDDNLVSGGHWLYMIHRRLEQADSAASIIQGVHADMDIIENDSYYLMCRFYQGAITEVELRPPGKSASSDDVLNYGLGNWYLYHEKDTTQARAHYRELLDNGNPFSFAYLAAEADWQRLFE